MYLKPALALLSVIIAFSFADASSVENENHHKSRAMKNFACNCLINELSQKEIQLGYEYLSVATLYQHDSVALHGFSKLFKNYWDEQKENMKKVMDYIIKRGGVVKVPSVGKLVSNQEKISNTTHELLEFFLDQEKVLKSHLLTLTSCVTDPKGLQETHERNCIARHNIKKSLNLHMDPMTAHFLEENFYPQRVQRLKFMSDLISRIKRFDAQNYDLGIHMIDKELQD